MSKQNQTSFRTHVEFDGCNTFNIIDYSEHRLVKLIEESKSKKRIDALINLRNLYVKGLVSISWKKGQPIYINK